MVFAQIVPASKQWMATWAAFLSAAAAAVWVWRKVGTAAHSILQTTLQWAVIIGAVGFCGGFFGPIIFTPESNQGPLLGLFITGPLGFVAGGVLGFIYALCFKPRRLPDRGVMLVSKNSFGPKVLPISPE